MNIFYNIEEKNVLKMLKCLEAKTIKFKKGSTIINNVANVNTLGIISKGEVNLIRADYYGNRTIIETLKENDIFESKMFNLMNNELSIIALEDTEVIMIEYNRVINRCKNNCCYHNQLIDNMLKIIIEKLNTTYERIQILTKKSIREKILEYFKFESYKNNKKRFKMSLSFTSLSEYLSVDRSALMREIKNLKEDNIIEINNKCIKLNY